MQKTHKIIRRKRKNRNRKSKKIISNFTGGGYRLDLPLCINLAEFYITDDDIKKFYRTFNSPKDCFINVLQLLRLINGETADLMRISSLGKSGFTKAEIELFFIYLRRTNFDLKYTENFETFTNTYLKHFEKIKNNNNAVFAGYKGHVFIIAKKNDGEIYYIDPQVGICDLKIPECLAKIKNNNNQPYYLLYSSVEILSP